MEEKWKDIKGYKGLYQVSNLGNVRSLNYKKSGKIALLKFSTSNTTGYCQVGLQKNGKLKMKYVHRLVAEAFLRNRHNYPQINHKDEQKLNNRADNLEFCTPKYNSNYGTRNQKTSEIHSIPIKQYDKEGNFIREWKSTLFASQELGIFATNITNCLKGRAKIAKGFIWRYSTDTAPVEKYLNPRFKIVNQYDKEGNFIRQWNSIQEASMKLKIKASTISSCLRRKKITAGGFIWRYSADITPISKNANRKCKQIDQYDKKGKFIRQWDSVKEASEKLGIRNICSCLKGFRKTAGKFVWKYAEEKISHDLQITLDGVL